MARWVIESVFLHSDDKGFWARPKTTTATALTLNTFSRNKRVVLPGTVH